MIDAFDVVVRGRTAIVTLAGKQYRGRVVSSGLSSEEGRPNLTLELLVVMPKGPVKQFDAEFPR